MEFSTHNREIMLLIISGISIQLFSVLILVTLVVQSGAGVVLRRCGFRFIFPSSAVCGRTKLRIFASESGFNFWVMWIAAVCLEFCLSAIWRLVEQKVVRSHLANCVRKCEMRNGIPRGCSWYCNLFCIMKFFDLINNDVADKERNAGNFRETLYYIISQLNVAVFPNVCHESDWLKKYILEP